MKNFTYADKQALQNYIQMNNRQVAEVAYDPGTVVGDPEAAAIAAGWVQYYKEVNPGLTEVIYTRPDA